jgi:hypothetical protein
MAEPGNSHPLAQGQRRDAFPQKLDPPHDLVSGRDGVFDMGKFTVQDMEIGAAHATGGYANADFSRSRRPVRELPPAQDASRLFKTHRMHEFASVSGSLSEDGRDLNARPARSDRDS